MRFAGIILLVFTLGISSTSAEALRPSPIAGRATGTVTVPASSPAERGEILLLPAEIHSGSPMNYRFNLLMFVITGMLITFTVAGVEASRRGLKQTRARLAFEQELRQADKETAGHILQELQEGLGQMLTAVHLQLEKHKLDHPDSSMSLEAASGYLDEANRQLRTLSQNPNTLLPAQINLKTAISQEIERMRILQRVKVDWSYHPGEGRSDRSYEPLVFRLLQELCQLSIRHSGSTHLNIQLYESAHLLELTLYDNGRRLNGESSNPAAARLLEKIRERVAVIRGELLVEWFESSGNLFILRKLSTLDKEPSVR